MMNQPSATLQNGTLCEIGVVVRNIESAAKLYAEVFGLPVPDIITTDPQEKANTKYRGRSTPARAKLAFLQIGAVALELIEPLGGPSVWKEFLDLHGPGIHHVAFQVEGMENVLGALNSRGIPTVQSGDFAGGRYAYTDATTCLGAIIELKELLAVTK